MFAITFGEALPLVIGAAILAALVVFPMILSRKRVGHRVRLEAERTQPERDRERSR